MEKLKEHKLRERRQALGISQKDLAEADLEKKDTKERLAELIDALPRKEKMVLALYYYEDLTMQEIGRVLSITEPRVCQLHSQALSKIKTKLKQSIKKDQEPGMNQKKKQKKGKKKDREKEEDQHDVQKGKIDIRI